MRDDRNNNSPMQGLPSALCFFRLKVVFGLICAALFIGCKSSYDVTLGNGRQFIGVSKPVLDKKTGKYQFKTPDGRVGTVHPDNIRLIEPHREAYEFRQTPQKK